MRARRPRENQRRREGRVAPRPPSGDSGSARRPAGSRSGRLPLPLWVPALALVPGLVLIAFTLLQDRVDPAMFYRDMFALTGRPPFVGAISNLGAFAWCATSAVCLFTAVVLHSAGGARRRVLCLAYFGLLSGLLLVDDFFMLHDYFLQVYFGVPPEVTIGALALLTLCGLLGFRRELLSLDWPILLAALGLFGLSVAIDVGADLRLRGTEYPSWVFVAEDIPKFLGVLLWAAFFGRAAWLSLMEGPINEAATGSPAPAASAVRDYEPR